MDNDSLIYAIASNPANGTVTLSGCEDFAIGSLPFSHQYSNTSAANNWDVSGSDGADIAYQLTLSDSTTIDVTTCAVFTDYDTKLEIFTADGTCAATTTSNYNDDDGVCTISNANPSSYAASVSYTHLRDHET